MRIPAHQWPWRWCLYWLLLPNIIVIVMWPIGGPPMGRPIFVAGLLALAFSQMRSLLLRRMAVAVLGLGITFEYIVNSFNLEAMRIDAASEFLKNAKPLASAEYLAGLVVLCAALALAVRGAGRVQHFARPSNWIFAICAILGMMQIDAVATVATSNTYKGLPPEGTPFASGVESGGLAQPGPARRHLVVIVVEALGIPTFEEGKRLFAADWDRPAWRGRYEVASGKVAYFGSTTNGEIRELCGAFANFDGFDFAHADCLPRRYSKAGYDTLAIHAFEGGFFDRRAWWPRAGFARTEFAPDLVRGGARKCGGMWPGACDVDIAAQIGQRLKSASRPQFIYWVTLNSHIPVLAGATPGLAGCEDGAAPLAHASLLQCRLFQAHHDIAEAISALAMDPALPPTDFLIVGDHMPPFMRRNERLDFDGYNVPWIVLRNRPA